MFNIIYFDENQLKDYFLGHLDYNRAYNNILGNIPKSVIWTGEIRDNQLVVIQGHEQRTIPFELISKIWVRGKDFNYKLFKNKKVEILNSYKIEAICEDKKETFKYLSNFMPRHFTKLEEAHKQEEVVVKPKDGLKGEGIIFKKGIEVTKEEILSDNLIVQEVISPNINNPDFKNLFKFSGNKLSESKINSFDIRLVVMNKVIELITVRYSQDRICNMHKGGNSFYINKRNFTDCPESMTKTINKINSFKDVILENLPNSFINSLFCVDFCINKEDKFVIYELNSYPGIRPQYNDYMNGVINWFRKESENRNRPVTGRNLPNFDTPSFFVPRSTRVTLTSTESDQRENQFEEGLSDEDLQEIEAIAESNREDREEGGANVVRSRRGGRNSIQDELNSTNISRAVSLKNSIFNRDNFTSAQWNSINMIFNISTNRNMSIIETLNYSDIMGAFVTMFQNPEFSDFSRLNDEMITHSLFRVDLDLDQFVKSSFLSNIRGIYSSITNTGSIGLRDIDSNIFMGVYGMVITAIRNRIDTVRPIRTEDNLGGSIRMKSIVVLFAVMIINNRANQIARIAGVGPETRIEFGDFEIKLISYANYFLNNNN